MTDHDGTRDRLRRAYQAARLSDDPHTQLGAIIVDRHGGLVAEAANVFPDGIARTAERMDRCGKLAYMIHAEVAALLWCARRGLVCEGATMYGPAIACQDCARQIVQAGIVRVVAHREAMARMTRHPWSFSIEQGNWILDEAGVKRDYYEGPIGGGVESLINGEVWKP